MRKLNGMFHIDGDELIKTSNGQPVPEDEPLFILRGRDLLAVTAIIAYREACAHISPPDRIEQLDPVITSGSIGLGESAALVSAFVHKPHGIKCVEHNMQKYLKSDAVISSCGKYRYLLSRVWSEDSPLITWIMLNPSVATAEIDDATIRRCINFSRSWGYGGMEVVNLFALRATDPSVLVTADDPIGPENNYYLQRIPLEHKIIAAWGVHGKLFNRSNTVKYLLVGRAVECLGKCANGEPKHPVRLAAATKLQEWL